MKCSNEFILREIAGEYILVPFGKNAIDFNGVVTLNATAKFLWEQCGDNEIDIEKLQNSLIAEYDIDKTAATEAVEIFVSQMKEAGCINE